MEIIARRVLLGCGGAQQLGPQLRSVICIVGRTGTGSTLSGKEDRCLEACNYSVIVRSISSTSHDLTSRPSAAPTRASVRCNHTQSSVGSGATTVGIQHADQETRRQVFNRILYRSRQRGYLELDLLLGKWAEQHISSLDDTTLHSLVALLDEENPDLWKWLTGQADAPDSLKANPVFVALHQQVADSLSAHTHPKTRAQPGSAWVRGWDDRDKRPAGSPPGGNQ